MTISPYYKSSTIWKIRGKNSWNLISNSNFVRSDKLWAKYYFREESSPIELGFVVSRKYGNAIKRNRFKRRVKNAIIELMRENVFPKNLVILIGISDKKSSELTYSEVKNSLKNIAKKAVSDEQ